MTAASRALVAAMKNFFFYFNQMQAKIPDSGSIQIIQTNESGIVATLFFEIIRE
jgi:hypothetical protein